jgi:hypothetical protein
MFRFKFLGNGSWYRIMHTPSIPYVTALIIISAPWHTKGIQKQSSCLHLQNVHVMLFLTLTKCSRISVVFNSYNEYYNWEIEITLRWYFFCKDCLTRPVYTPHIHHAKSKPSQMRNDVPGWKPWKTAVAAASARPPSTHTAWQMHGVVQGVSSLKLSIFLPNRTQGQNSPVQPFKV